MRHIITLFAVLAIALSAFAADTTIATGISIDRGDASYYKRYQLSDETVSSVDSIAAGEAIHFGPYPVGVGSRVQGIPYTHLRFWSDSNATGGEDSLVASVQFLPDSNIADTAAADWLSVDALVAVTGGWGDTALPVNNKAASALFWKLNNTSGSTIVLQRKIYFALERQ